ncbi:MULTISPECIES: cyclic di-GMP phosphodiesterase [Aquitalea]|uniref:Cyclic di-GMP phosphodiesterase Gmr n=1 Tax=Aquitalea magnusonii TaxID=332411 RepID=A0A318JK36_9NEIS|nr:cyclic di-GMP phosphodiesterase [Aquitalea magnusonii]PXX50985.1 cyclic di-GMP phosphodiesterase Gmr [Aquitalea magnusonii]
MIDLTPSSWLTQRFGTDSPRWRLPPDSNALYLSDADDRMIVAIALSNAQAEDVRKLEGSTATVAIETQLEGIPLGLILIGRRTDHDEWRGVATWCNDTAAVRREMERGLNFSEQVISEVSSLIVIVDDQGNIKRFNRECERLSGKTEAEVMGKNALELFFSAEESEKIRANLTTFFRSMHSWETERHILTKDGPRLIWWRNRLVRNATVDQWFLVCSGTDITEQRRAQARLEEQASTDSTTGLPNRHAIQSIINLAVATRPVKPFDLLFLDLDNFKNINDHYGHAIGDLLIARVGQALREQIGPGDVLARFGGDEFLLLLYDATPEKTASVCRQIRTLMETPFTLQHIQVYSGCSIGVASFPADGESLSELVRNADTAMYAAKAANKGGVMHFSREMNNHLQESMWLDGGLRQALQEGQFSLHYQPQVCLRSRRATSVEALIRWQSSERGMVPPLSFIRYAEDSGLIKPIGRWVIREAMAQARRWSSLPQPLRISVNLSARQLGDPELLSDFMAAMQQHGFKRSPLDIELTESCIASDEGRTIEIMSALRALGVNIHLDDFGTGYSSLSQLTRLPLQVIKMDQSFIRAIPADARSMALLRSMVAVAQQLDFQIVAEGVETDSQLDFISEIGVDLAQGYHFARPMPADQLEQWLQQHGKP